MRTPNNNFTQDDAILAETRPLPNTVVYLQKNTAQNWPIQNLFCAMHMHILNIVIDTSAL